MDKNFETIDVYTRMLETDSRIKQGIINKQYFTIQRLHNKCVKNFIGDLIVGGIITILIMPALMKDDDQNKKEYNDLLFKVAD